MLYLDASALAKRYFNEKGSELVAARFENGEKIFTSMLSYAEIHSVIARKFRGREFGRDEFSRLRDSFQSDWLFGLSKLELDSGAMKALPGILERLPLKAGDAIHLSTAIWLRDSARTGAFGGPISEDVEFGVADKRLAEAALQYGLRVFDPEGKI
ncbi:MAG TPA: type II toxin-antitoxin system VapC family toxin [Verrucomicrobiae bacterium]|jgi:predicted nucleic acid-binding protein|nr:type II toxin-antitoxin system VapC family toxin [Verrucomicrobiae bacterium]